MTIGTRPSERIPLAPVQQRAEQHIDVTLAFGQDARDDRAGQHIVADATSRDAMGDIRRMGLYHNLYQSLTTEEQRAAFSDLYQHIERDENSEDGEREALTHLLTNGRATAASAVVWSRDITPDCTGERPS